MVGRIETIRFTCAVLCLLVAATEAYGAPAADSAADQSLGQHPTLRFDLSAGLQLYGGRLTRILPSSDGLALKLGLKGQRLGVCLTGSVNFTEVAAEYAESFGVPTSSTDLRIGYWRLETGYSLFVGRRLRITPLIGVSWFYAYEFEFDDQGDWAVTDYLSAWSKPAPTLGFDLGWRLPRTFLTEFIGDHANWVRLEVTTTWLDFGDHPLGSGTATEINLGFSTEWKVLP
jgi:hypothetical protein